jgi:hypothetical protein
MIRIIIVIFVLNSIFGFQSSCDKRKPANNQVREIFNVDSKVELLFLFKKDSSKEEQDYFYENVLMKPVNGGHWVRDGVKAAFGIDKNGYTGFGISFTENATKGQREDIIQRLKESPIVYKVYENVVPNQIKDL